MNDEWLTTGETASMLGVSRQHVVNLCDRGQLSYTKSGTHRRIRRCDLLGLVAPQLTREQEKSLWLHRALLGHLMLNPQSVLEVAQTNIAQWQAKHRSDGMAAWYLDQWEHVIDSGIDSVISVLTEIDEESIELRQNTPFAGVISDGERRQVLRSFRDYWDREHAAA